MGNRWPSTASQNRQEPDQDDGEPTRTAVTRRGHSSRAAVASTTRVAIRALVPNAANDIAARATGGPNALLRQPERHDVAGLERRVSLVKTNL